MLEIYDHIYISLAIDQLFETPGLYYVFTHQFVERALFYLSSCLKVPSFANTNVSDYTVEEILKIMIKMDEFIETAWVGQKGGCEGLRQKGWPTFTMEAALWAVEELSGIVTYNNKSR